MSSPLPVALLAETSESLLLKLAAIVVLGVGAQWLAWRLKLPSILLLLIAGLAVGPGMGIISVDGLLGDLLTPLVSLAVGVILFEGGLSLDLRELKQIGRTLGQLIVMGVIVTCILATAAAHWIVGLDFGLSLLLGAILSVTGPTVVGPLLRHVRPRGQVGPLANWEGIVADVIGATLAVLIFLALKEGEVLGRHSIGDLSMGLLKTLGAGAVVGTVCGVGLLWALRRHWVPDALQSPAALAVVLGGYAISDHWQHESGLLAVTLIGMIVRNQHKVPVGHIVAFKENLRTLLISSLFIVLAAKVNRADATSIGMNEILFVIVLILVIRPVAVWFGTVGTNLPRNERIFLAFLAPRGVVAAAVSAMFGAQLSMSGAERLAPLTFLVIIATVSFYGLAAAPIAKKLGLADDDAQGLLLVGAGPFARALGLALTKADVPAVVVDSNRLSISEAKLAGLKGVYANALDEHAMEALPLGGIGRVLAVTPNDEVNSLAVLQYTELFGRKNAYQLAPRRGGQTEGASTDLKGRTLFGEEVTFGELARRLRDGYEVRATPLTEAFDLEAWRAHHGTDAVLLLKLDGEGKVTLFTDEEKPDVGAGETLFGLVPPDGPDGGSETA